MPRTNNSTSLSLEEKEKINALCASGNTDHAIAKALNRSPHTISRHLKRPEAQEKIEVIKKELADLFEDLARRMVSSITNEDILNLNAYQRTISSGIATDKLRLLRNEPTEIVDTREYSQRLNALLIRIEQSEKNGGE